MFFLEGTKLRAILIKEGISANKNQWTRKVLEQIAGMSDGVPIHFYDMSKSGDGSLSHHWEALRMKMPPGIKALLPEKLPGSQVGVVRNPTVVVGDDGKSQVVGDVETSDNGWFSSMVEGLRDQGKKMGLSIFVPERGIKWIDHASGVREPTEVTEVVSYDAVSFPSAGGQLMPALEALGQPAKEVDQMKWKNLVKRLRCLVPKDKQGALDKLTAPADGVDTVAGLLESNADYAAFVLESNGYKVEGDARAPFLEGLLATTPEDPKDKPVNKPVVKVPVTPVTPVVESVTRDEFKALSDTLQGVVRDNSTALLEVVIEASKLPKAMQDFVRNQFKGVIESAGVIKKDDIEVFIKGLKSGLGGSQNPTLEARNANAIVNAQVSSGDEFLAAFQAMYMRQPHGFVGEGDKKVKVPAYDSIRRAYADLTGDVHCDGREFYMKNRGRRTGILESVDVKNMRMFQEFSSVVGNSFLEELLINSSFIVINSENLHQAVVREYQTQALDWRLVASPQSVSDFKTWRWNRIGEFPNLPVVIEGGTYANDWSERGPNEEEITLKITKKGGQFSMTWEMVVNDATHRLQQYPSKVARAAMRTLNDAVFSLVVDNGTIYDATALATVGHTNYINAAYSITNAKLMRKQMSQQKDTGWQNNSGVDQGGLEIGRVSPKRFFVGSDLYDQVYEDLFTDGKPILAGTDSNAIDGTPNTLTRENPAIPNVLRSKWGIELAPAQQYIDDNDADVYFMGADPNVADMIYVGFYRGRQDPELFVQDMQNVGSFFDNDAITHKVRHVYKAAVADFRSFQVGIP